MQSVDLLIADIGWLITMDARRRVIRDAAIAVDARQDRRGRQVGASCVRNTTRGAASTAAPPWRPRASSTAICTPRSSFRAASPTKRTRSRSCSTACIPTRRRWNADDVRVSAMLAAAELLKHGVTCFIDPGNYHPEAAVEGAMATGIRMIVSRSSFDLTKSVLGILPERMIETTAAALERASAVLERHGGTDNPKLGASASFRGLNNASDALITGLKQLADRHGALLQTHACFSYSTHDSSLARTGKAEIERLESLGVIDERMLIVHSGWLEPEEVAILARRKPSLVCAPSSSLHNGYGNFLFGKLPELLALGVNVAIGSDHASSGIVDMSQEIRLACCCYKETRINPRVMPPETGLEMATVNGAKAALMGDRIGSIELGKEADIVLFDSDRPEWQPLINPVSNLVYSATGDSVRDVFVMGEQVVADGRLARIDEAKLIAEVPVAVARFGRHLEVDRMVQLKWPVE